MGNFYLEENTSAGFANEPPRTKVTIMLKFRINYFIITIVLFLTELVIALFVHDGFIRPYAGDFLIVIFLYCLARSFVNAPVFPTAITVLLFSCFVETLQFFNIVEILGVQSIRFWRVVIGTSFAWADILAYSLGVFCIILFEKKWQAKRLTRNAW